MSPREMTLEEVIGRIIDINEGLMQGWSDAHGWAPDKAADLLSKSRLDWLVSLSHCLRHYVAPFSSEERDGQLILAYANLGALVEGTLKILLCLYVDAYAEDVAAFSDKRGRLLGPDRLGMEQLRQFCAKRVWSQSDPQPDGSRQEEVWSKWVERIQYRRNAVHAYQDRDIGTQAELHEDIRKYLEFLEDTASRFPPEPEQMADW